MTNPKNPFGDGRWNTGSRPIQTGPAQSAYDQGVQQRQQQERMQREQAAQRDRDAQKQREQYQKEYGPGARKNRNADDAGAGGQESEDDGGGLEGWLALAGIGGFVVLIVVVWNAILGMLPATTGNLATALNYSPWAVGVVAAGVGLRISRFLMHIAGWMLGAAVLFFGSAIAYGVYQGMTGEG